MDQQPTRQSADESSAGDSSPRPLFEIRPVAKLAGMAAAAGFIALGTIIIEILTGSLPAKMLGFSSGFVSLPMGIVTPFLAALTARSIPKYAIPGLVFAAAYWLLFAIYL